MVHEDRIEEFIMNGDAAYAGKCDRSLYVRLYVAGL